MNLKTLHLLYPIKLPWSVHYSEFVEPRDDWKASLEGGLIYIRQGGTVRFVVSASMLRFAEVADAAPTAPIAAPLAAPTAQPAQAIQVPAKRRPGRPPKVQLG